MTSYFDHFIIIKLIFSYFTNFFIILVIVFFVFCLLFIRLNLIPKTFQLIIESIINHWYIVIEENIGKNGSYYLIVLISLFMFLLGLNILGFFMYVFPVTTHISITFGMALLVWIGVIIMGFYKFNNKFLSIFIPSGAPILLSPLLVFIELVSNLSRPIALGMRLAANLTAGHILLTILGDFGCKLLLYSPSLLNLFPIFIIIFMTILEIGVLVIQAYVFCLLFIIYLKDSLELH